MSKNLGFLTGTHIGDNNYTHTKVSKRQVRPDLAKPKAAPKKKKQFRSDVKAEKEGVDDSNVYENADETSNVQDHAAMVSRNSHRNINTTGTSRQISNRTNQSRNTQSALYKSKNESVINKQRSVPISQFTSEKKRTVSLEKSPGEKVRDPVIVDLDKFI